MRRMPENIPNSPRHQPCVVWLGLRCPEKRDSALCASRHRPLGGLMRRIVLAALVIAACTNDATQPTTVGLSFSVVSGDGQSGVVGQPLPNPLVIKATDSRGRPQKNLQVSFIITSGGGSANP